MQTYLARHRLLVTIAVTVLLLAAIMFTFVNFTARHSGGGNERGAVPALIRGL